MQAQLLASRDYYLLYVARTIYYIHVAVVVRTSCKKSHYTQLVFLIDLLIYNNKLDLEIVQKLVEYLLGY